VTAKKVFISNAPGQNLPASLGGPDRTYNEFYAAMKSWGRYELVSAPADADMIFEISLASSIVGVGGTSSSGCSSSSEADLRLAILDAKTRVPLWWFAEPIIQKRMMFHAEKAGDAFSDTLPKLLDDIRKLLGQPAVSLDGEKR